MQRSLSFKCFATCLVQYTCLNHLLWSLIKIFGRSSYDHLAALAFVPLADHARVSLTSTSGHDKGAQDCRCSKGSAYASVPKSRYLTTTLRAERSSNIHPDLKGANLLSIQCAGLCPDYCPLGLLLLLISRPIWTGTGLDPLPLGERRRRPHPQHPVDLRHRRSLLRLVSMFQDLAQRSKLIC